MASKHGRDQATDFHGFLSDLQDWELSFKGKGKDKQMKTQVSLKPGDTYKSNGKASTADDFLRSYSSVRDVPNGLMNEDHVTDANSEKEQGNEYFKQKKFNEAIDSYSRSIVLSPTAAAYANRAIAYLKIKRYREAEEDCTDALNLDDRYIKAYSRRSTARKELGKLKDAMDDAEFALRLEPQNQELKKQFANIKALLEKEIVDKASTAMRSSVQDVLKDANSETMVNVNTDHSLSTAKQSPKTSTAGPAQPKKDKHGSKNGPLVMEVPESENRRAMNGDESKPAESKNKDASQASCPRKHSSTKEDLEPSFKKLASRAAFRAMTEASRKIKAPKSAYEFENSWRGFSGDVMLQAQLLKVTQPSQLPQIFKNALTAPILIDIIKCVATFFMEDMDLAVKYIENLTKVPRFNMLIMCLSATEKSELKNIWVGVFDCKEIPVVYADIMGKMKSKYCST